MKIYWYAPWPDDRAWASVSLAAHIVQDGDEMVLHKLRSSTGPSPTGPVRVVADLPEVSPATPWTPRWALDRTMVVTGRARRRNALIRRLRPDIVHLQLVNRFTDPWMLPSGSIVATVHDVLPHHGRLPRRAERLLLAALYAKLDAVVVHHPLVGQQLQAGFGVPGDRIHHVPLVIAPNGAPASRSGLDSPLVLFFGSFRRNKGIAELCQAIRSLADEHHLRFHLAGRGDAEAERRVRELARDDPRVTATIGYVPNNVKDTLFRRASLVVLPYSSFTSQSAVLGDAYAGGAPVLVADVGALGASVREDGTGWILASTRPHHIAEAIVSSLADPVAWQHRAGRAAMVAAQRAPEAVGRSYRALYATLNRGRAA